MLTRSIRAFFAINLPEQTKNEVGDIISQLKNAHHPGIIRWVQPDNLHITLQFIASIKNRDIEKLLKQAQLHLHDCHTFKLKLTELELFPSAHHPHIISLNMFPTEPLALLAKFLGIAITDCGYSIETRPFRAHLTLGKIKAEHFTPQLNIPQLNIPEFNLNEIVLYRSEPNKEGSNYIELGKILI